MCTCFVGDVPLHCAIQVASVQWVCHQGVENLLVGLAKLCSGSGLADAFASMVTRFLLRGRCEMTSQSRNCLNSCLQDCLIWCPYLQTKLGMNVRFGDKSGFERPCHRSESGLNVRFGTRKWMWMSVSPIRIRCKCPLRQVARWATIGQNPGRKTKTNVSRLVRDTRWNETTKGSIPVMFLDVLYSLLRR